MNDPEQLRARFPDTPRGQFAVRSGGRCPVHGDALEVGSLSSGSWSPISTGAGHYHAEGQAELIRRMQALPDYGRKFSWTHDSSVSI